MSTEPVYALGDACADCHRTDWITSVILGGKRICSRCLGVRDEHAAGRPTVPAKPVKVRKK